MGLVTSHGNCRRSYDLDIITVGTDHATWHGLRYLPENRLEAQRDDETPKGAAVVYTLKGQDVIPISLPQIGPQPCRISLGVDLGQEGVHVDNVRGSKHGTEDGGAGDGVEEVSKVQADAHPALRGCISRGSEGGKEGVRRGGIAVQW